jgi:hypothetical protein
MKGRDGDGKYPPEVQDLVEAGSRDNSEIVLTRADLEKLGHGHRSPTKAMRAFCVDCMGGQFAEVKRCTSVGCSLWPYRMGKNPFFGSGGES